MKHKAYKVSIFLLIFLVSFSYQKSAYAFYKSPGSIKVLSIILIQPDPTNPTLVDGAAMPVYSGKQ